MKTRRYTHPLLEAKRARQNKQNATLAVRQSAGLSRDEREALKPLVEAADDYDDGNEMREIRFDDSWFVPTHSWSQLMQQNIQSMWAIPSSLGSVGALQGSWAYAVPSTIDTDRLAALKNTEPQRVTPRVPDLVQVITGWRGWKLKDGLLGALGVDATWPAREALRATCKSGSSESHLAPAWSCNCGVWAFKDMDGLIAALSGNYSVDVIGSVSLWGRVIETENGYRAQYAYPSELWLVNESLEELGLIYDVPVRR